MVICRTFIVKGLSPAMDDLRVPADPINADHWGQLPGYRVQNFRVVNVDRDWADVRYELVKVTE